MLEDIQSKEEKEIDNKIKELFEERKLLKEARWLKENEDFVGKYFSGIRDHDSKVYCYVTGLGDGNILLGWSFIIDRDNRIIILTPEIHYLTEIALENCLTKKQFFLAYQTVLDRVNNPGKEN